MSTIDISIKNTQVEDTKEYRFLSRVLIVWGLIFTFLPLRTLYVKGLGLLVGTIFLFHVFRTIRLENKWFRFGYFSFLIYTVFNIAFFFLDTTILEYTYSFINKRILHLICDLIFSLVLLLFSIGVKRLEKKKELKRRTISLFVLPLWVLAFAAYTFKYYDKEIPASFVSVILPISFILLVLFLNRLLKHLDHEKLFCVAPIIKGFPKDIIDDIKAEDILRCKDAARVHCTNEDMGLGLNISSITVALPSNREKCIVFRYYRWDDNKSFHGTECLDLSLPIINKGLSYEISGQVLYNKSDEVYVSNYYSIEDRELKVENNNEYRNHFYATFSLPRKCENCRGYIAYTHVGDISKVFYDDLTYVHQFNRCQYHVKTAKYMYESDQIDSMLSFPSTFSTITNYYSSYQ